jgi:hypothetical protein
MNINLLVLGLMVVGIGLHVGHAIFSSPPPPNPNNLPWVPISTGKERSFVSKTRDAGMYTENLRRVAVISGYCGSGGSGGTGMPKYKGSTNGSLEFYFLSGLCPVRPSGPVCPPEFEIEDGGNANTESCVIIDENVGELIDLGNANTNVCPT